MNTAKKKTNSKKGKMTLDKLALMMGRGFNEVTERFNEVNARIDALDEKFSDRFAEADIRFDKVDKKLEEMTNIQDSILKRLDDLEVDNKMDVAAHHRFEEKENGLASRVSRLEQTVEKIKGKVKI